MSTVSPVRKLTVPLAIAVAAALITAVLMSTVFSPASFNTQTRTAGSYAEDRAAIEDLQATTTIPIDAESSTVLGTTKTNWSRSTASGSSRSA
jgi:uridine phosphorylase